MGHSKKGMVPCFDLTASKAFRVAICKHKWSFLGILSKYAWR